MNKIDPIILLLSGLLIFCIVVTVFVGIKSPDDGMTFTWASGLCTGLLGMIGLRIKPARTDPADESVSTTTTTTKSLPDAATVKAKESAELTDPPKVV